MKAFRDLQALGAVHRDVKPNNVLLYSEHCLKLSDLGAAKAVAPDLHLTVPGDRIGSLLYISPNQRTDPAAVTPEDDWYSICLIMYEIASGRRIHLQNPPLTQLLPIGYPLELLVLIDAGMAQAVPWQELYAEMQACLDLEHDTLAPSYGGSLLTPSAVVTQHLSAATHRVHGALRERGRSPELNQHRTPTLIDQITSEIVRGFRTVADSLLLIGVFLAINDGVSDDETLMFSMNHLTDEFESLIEEYNLTDAIFERLYGWIQMETLQDGGVRIVGLGSKRLDVVPTFLPADWEGRVIVSIDGPTGAFLRRFGQAIALGAALDGINWAADYLIDEIAEGDGEQKVVDDAE